MNESEKDQLAKKLFISLKSYTSEFLIENKEDKELRKNLEYVLIIALVNFISDIFITLDNILGTQDSKEEKNSKIERLSGELKNLILLAYDKKVTHKK